MAATTGVTWVVHASGHCMHGNMAIVCHFDVYRCETHGDWSLVTDRWPHVDAAVIIVNSDYTGTPAAPSV